MGYQVYNNGASIAFTKDGNTLLLMKSSLIKVSIIGGDIVRISMGNCLSGISFHYRDVSSPFFFSASELANQISYWIFVIELPPGPNE